MLARQKFSSVQHIIRRSSKLAIRENQPSKFAVVNGKFVRVPAKDGQIVKEEITHTGMFYDEGDWRRNRFHDRKKLVNQNWAVRMVAEIPPTEVEGRVAVCDGREGPDGPPALGHPRVYINLHDSELSRFAEHTNRSTLNDQIQDRVLADAIQDN